MITYVKMPTDLLKSLLACDVWIAPTYWKQFPEQAIECNQEQTHDKS